MNGRYYFTLTEESFAAHEALLSQQGVKVCPKSRSTSEDLEQGKISYVSINGSLVHDDCEYPYELYHGSKNIHLTVDLVPVNDKRGSGKSLFDAIGRAFPQPERGFPPRPRPERKLDWGEIIGRMGCVAVVVVIISTIIFAVVGVWSVLRH